MMSFGDNLLHNKLFRRTYNVTRFSSILCTEILQLTNIDTERYNDEEVSVRSCLQQISVVMSRDLTAKHEQLIHLLEARLAFLLISHS